MSTDTPRLDTLELTTSKYTEIDRFQTMAGYAGLYRMTLIAGVLWEGWFIDIMVPEGTVELGLVYLFT